MFAFDAVVAGLLKEGLSFPVSPLMNHSILGRHSIPGNWDFWQHYSRRLLARCDELVIVPLPGWETSTGVQGEIEIANMLSLPIRHVPWDVAEFRKGVVSALAEEHRCSEAIAADAYDRADQRIEQARELLIKRGRP